MVNWKKTLGYSAAVLAVAGAGFWGGYNVGTDRSAPAKAQSSEINRTVQGEELVYKDGRGEVGVMYQVEPGKWVTAAEYTARMTTSDKANARDLMSPR